MNAGFLVGHCALRRRVMGADAVGGTATAEQIERCARCSHESLAAGGLGLSTSRAFTHSDGDGEPVPSRHAAPDEVLALCEVVREHPGTTLEAITDGCLNGFSDDEVDLFARMSARSAPAAELERAHDRRGQIRATRSISSRRRRVPRRRAVGSSRSPCRSSSA